jgi:hypothetical protein
MLQWRLRRSPNQRESNVLVLRARAINPGHPTT